MSGKPFDSRLTPQQARAMVEVMASRLYQIKNLIGVASEEDSMEVVRNLLDATETMVRDVGATCEDLLGGGEILACANEWRYGIAFADAGKAGAA